MTLIGWPRSIWKWIVATLAVAVLPATVWAADVQPTSAQSLFGDLPIAFSGTIDVQPGLVDGQVALESASASLHAALSDPGVAGQLSVTVPGLFAGTSSAANGALSYDLAVCGPGVTVGLRGTSVSDVQLSFHDAASDPNACSAAPLIAQSPRILRPLDLAAPPAQSDVSDGDGRTLLLNWLRRLVGFSLLAFLLVLLIPAMPDVLGVATQSPPWGRIGIGLALVLTLPVVGLLLFAFGLPVGLWWLGVLVLAVYPVLLVLSMSVSALAVGSWLSQHLQRPAMPILLAFALGMLVLSFVSLLPYVGPPINLAAVIFGLGTLVLAPRSNLPARPPAAAEIGGPTRERPTPAVPPTQIAA